MRVEQNLLIMPAAFFVSAMTLAVWAHSFRALLSDDASAVAAFAFAGTAYLGLLGSLLVHEFAHVLVARAHGNGCKHVSLTPFGLLAALDREPGGPREEALVVAVGPLANLVLAPLFWLLQDLPGLLGILCYVLFLVNLGLALFNFVPCFPMDGGRLVRAAAWAWTGDRLRATVFAARVGWIGGLAIAGYGLFLLSRGNPLGLVTVLIALAMVAFTARHVRHLKEAARFDGKTAAGLMRPFGREGTPGDVQVTLEPDGLRPDGEPGVELWRGSGQERIGVLPASAIRTVRPEASVTEMMAAFTTPPVSGWPILLVGEGTPQGYVTQGQIRALLD